MLRVELAHHCGRLFCFRRRVSSLRDFGTNLGAERHRIAQVRIVAAGVNGGQDAKQSFIVIKRDLRRIFSNAKWRDNSKQGDKQRNSILTNQEPSCTVAGYVCYIVSLRGSEQRVNQANGG